MTGRPPEYLGDGVYLTDDGYQLWIAVGDHRNLIVALDEGVFTALMRRGLVRFQFINMKEQPQ